MKTIGLVGGMSWESSIEYYRIINELVRQRLGGMHSARCVMYSVDFADVEIHMKNESWDDVTRIIIDAARHVEHGGADFALICTNTMHKMADDVQKAIGIPLLHIADAAAERVRANGMKKIGLLGTRFTMEEDFYCGRLKDKYGLDVLVPDEKDCELVHRVIFEELVVGKIEPSSRLQYIDIIERMVGKGAAGIVLGCTEIGLLLKDGDSPAPLFDTTRIHAEAAVELAFADQ